MIRHIVFWNLKEEAEGKTKEQNAAVIREGLEALVDKVDGLLMAEVRRNFNPGGMDLCLVSEFESKEALNAYQTNPLHVKVKEFVHKVVTDRAVTDCEL
ncbi:MAG: stress responsive protein [Clostridiales bacterium]|nr:MAG: stress responsive protein [Clostridiales bacterium]